MKLDVETGIQLHDLIMCCFCNYCREIAREMYKVPLEEPVFRIGVECLSSSSHIYKSLEYMKNIKGEISIAFTQKNSEDLFIYCGKFAEFIMPELMSFGKLTGNFPLGKNKVDFYKTRVAGGYQYVSYIVLLPRDIILNNILSLNSTEEEIRRNFKALFFARVCDLNLYAGDQGDFILHKIRRTLYTHDAIYDLLSKSHEGLNKKFLINDEKQMEEHIKRLNEDYDRQWKK